MKGVVAIAKTNRCVVRNQAYRRDGFSLRERHNERKNVDYQNGDIVSERSVLNVFFKSCAGTVEQEFNRMVESGAISLRGLKADAKVFDELVFDVNSAYFEERGGYEYAKDFFAEAYKLAVKEAGGEEYVLSAVLHADERNKVLSEQAGRDVFHYHLHVLYVPVVDKEIRWTKRCKDPALVGTVRETVKQVSHSKKWPRFKYGQGHWVNSYSLLQDRFYEHMRAAGYVDFERGERGSTAEHLSVLEYKTQQETERAAALAAEAAQKQKTVAALDEKAAKKQRQLDGLEKKTAIAKQAAITFSEIEGMGGKTNLRGDVVVSPANWKTVSGLAKEGVKTRSALVDMKKRIADFMQKIAGLEKELAQYKGMGITDSLKYYQAKQRAPRRLAEIVADILRKPPERNDQERPMQKSKSKDLDR
jgi:hypothetical protein